MKHCHTNTDTNTSQRHRKPTVAVYIRVGTAAQLEKPKTGLEIHAPVYRPEAILRKNSK